MPAAIGRRGRAGFLHADTRLPADADGDIEGLASLNDLGRFDVTIEDSIRAAARRRR